MTCSGCSGAVTRALTKKSGKHAGESPNSPLLASQSATYTSISFVADGGIDSFDVNLEKQEVIVRGSAEYEDVLGAIKKTGKEVSCDIHRNIPILACVVADQALV